MQRLYKTITRELGDERILWFGAGLLVSGLIITFAPYGWIATASRCLVAAGFFFFIAFGMVAPPASNSGPNIDRPDIS